jgi:ATP-dependent DNA helicase PIF1
MMLPEEWKLERGTEVVASRTQVPLLLGWCLSIHKSQGMTIALIETDISACWDYGQAYVALSRATSLEGLTLLGYRRDRIKAHPHVLQYYEELDKGGAGPPKSSVVVVSGGSLTYEPTENVAAMERHSSKQAKLLLHEEANNTRKRVRSFLIPLWFALTKMHGGRASAWLGVLLWISRGLVSPAAC